MTFNVFTIIPHARLAQAVLGGTVVTPGLKGDVKLTVRVMIWRVCLLTRHLGFQLAPRTQHGQSARLPGRGMPRVQGSGAGDHYVHYEIELPTCVAGFVVCFCSLHDC
jgi:DnaJ-class molecular chaperone